MHEPWYLVNPCLSPFRRLLNLSFSWNWHAYRTEYCCTALWRLELRVRCGVERVIVRADEKQTPELRPINTSTTNIPGTVLHCCGLSYRINMYQVLSYQTHFVLKEYPILILNKWRFLRTWGQKAQRRHHYVYNNIVLWLYTWYSIFYQWLYRKRSIIFGQ